MEPLHIVKVGPDRDPSRFDLDAKTMQRRRTLFWEIFAAENLYVSSFVGGGRSILTFVPSALL